eukprot:8670406-Pyramimonas_sp.AAC.1
MPRRSRLARSAADSLPEASCQKTRWPLTATASLGSGRAASISSAACRPRVSASASSSGPRASRKRYSLRIFRVRSASGKAREGPVS